MAKKSGCGIWIHGLVLQHFQSVWTWLTWVVDLSSALHNKHKIQHLHILVGVFGRIKYVNGCWQVLTHTWNGVWSLEYARWMWIIVSILALLILTPSLLPCVSLHMWVPKRKGAFKTYLFLFDLCSENMQHTIVYLWIK